MRTDNVDQVECENYEFALILSRLDTISKFQLLDKFRRHLSSQLKENPPTFGGERSE